MKETLISYRQHLLERLAAIVGDIARAAEALPQERLHKPLENGESPHRMLAHMRFMGAQAFTIRMQRMLNEEEPYLPLFDDGHWMDAHYNPHEPLEVIISSYIQLRREQLDLIKDLSSHSWNRTARHPWWGVKTLQWWVEQILRHDKEHLQKLRQANSG